MSSFIIKYLENIILTNETKEDNETINSYVLALAMYINFNYEKIVCNENMLEFLTTELSLKHIDEIAVIHPSYTRRQLESIYIAFNVFIYLCFLMTK